MTNGLDGYRAWLSGSRDALESTVGAYNKRLIFYIFGMLGDTSSAEDTAADTFLRLLVKKPKFDSEEQLCTWLYKVARNLALDRLRKKKSGDLPLESAEEREDREALLGEVLDSERKTQLYSALSELNDEYRSVLTLLYFEELSYTDVARVLSKNEKQVKNLAFRARAALKEKLERMGFTYEE